MKDFSGFDNVSGSFPSVVATNSSSATSRDGTPLTAAVLNDIWGAFQAILSAAGVTPSDSVETATASDLLDSLRAVSGAPGELVWHAAPSETGLDARVLPLKGQVITVASYAELVAATYVGNSLNEHASAFYKTSDAGGTTRATGGSYFVLPDCRGRFIRALTNDATGRDAAIDYNVGLGDSFYKYHSGVWELESVSQHVHNIQTDDSYGMEKETHYVLPSSPGTLTGAAGIVTPEARFMYNPASLGASAFNLTAKASVTGDYYDELRPDCVVFQLGIRY